MNCFMLHVDDRKDLVRRIVVLMFQGRPMVTLAWLLAWWFGEEGFGIGRVWAGWVLSVGYGGAEGDSGAQM